MRKAPQNGGYALWLMALLLTLCMMLLTTLSPLYATAGSREVQDGDLAVALMTDGEDGRGTDDDGVIGNGRRGADRADESRMRDATPHPMPRALPREAMPEGDSAANGENSQGILPWIVGSLVALAVVLVILALIPKKNRSH